MSVVWSDLIDSDQKNHQLSSDSDSDSDVAKSWLVHHIMWYCLFPTDPHPSQTTEKGTKKNQKKENVEQPKGPYKAVLTLLWLWLRKYIFL